MGEKQRELEALPVGLTFLLRSPESVKQPTLARVLESWPGIRVLLDDWAYDPVEVLHRRLAELPGKVPQGAVGVGHAPELFRRHQALRDGGGLPAGQPWTRRQIAAVVLFLLLAALLAVLFFSLRTERRLVPVTAGKFLSF